MTVVVTVRRALDDVVFWTEPVEVAEAELGRHQFLAELEPGRIIEYRVQRCGWPWEERGGRWR